MYPSKFKSPNYLVFKTTQTMNQQKSRKLAINWLNNKFIQHNNNGILLEEGCCEIFDVVQNFLESVDKEFKTPAIYYQAFPEESAIQFFDTLGAELTSKSGEHKVCLHQSLADIIEKSSLKMVIIDKSHLHPLDTLNRIIELFASCNVCLILIGPSKKMAIAQILNHPTVTQWDRFSVCKKHKSSPKIC